MAGLRVLHIGKHYPPDTGGMEVYLRTLLETQRAQGIDASAIVHGTPQPDDPAWLIRVPTLGKVLYAPIAPRFRRRLREAIRKLSPDVLHVHMPNASAFFLLALASAARLPWVVHWHSDVVFKNPISAIGLAYSIYAKFEKALLEQAKRIVVTSPAYLDASEPLRPFHAKCVVTPLGIAPELCDANEQQETLVHWSLGKFRLLSIGRLTHYKGFATLIEAVSAMPDVELIIAGDGELRAELDAAIRRCTLTGLSPNVRLIGTVSEAEKNALLDGCELFCLASCERTEAFGVVLLEAMQFGKPSLVSDLHGSGMPWVVRTANCGDLVPVNDIQAWRTAISRMHRNPEQRRIFGENGRRTLRTRFDIRSSSRDLEGVYAALAPERRACTNESRLLIVIPAKDESASISGVITQLIRNGYPDIVVINDQSSDDTAALASRAGAAVISPPLPLGAWGAMQTGIRFGLRHGFGAVITMDADGQHEVSEIPNLLAQSQHAEVVIGACPARGSAARKLAWAWFRKLTGLGFEDLTSGFRYYSRSAMELLAHGEATLFDYQDIGVLLLLRRNSIRITEVPVSMQLRYAGKSRIFYSWLAVASYMFETTLLCLARWSANARHRSKS